ncbi:hypothetical protein [Phormidium sp. FACHB-1136]|jgi:hypothetical protein|uniref:hypothetical protein n=1 Tax=Phormidium sp. FACHB-1136 TaxID=2692848 RepID=UPI001687A150|nr:hypothetical protein [Phormidium sp. FACHB-1136]MBD2428742.1 hypothetical protein [Phormidium sp. FACHB-1136]
MVKSSLNPFQQRRQGADPADHTAQLALAIADEVYLRSLLTDSLPTLAQPYEIGTISVQVGVPLRDHPQYSIDGVLTFEHIHCVLAGSGPEVPPLPEFQTHTEYQSVTHCHSDLSTLAENVAPSEAVNLLARAGFDADHIRQILQLPSQAWHHSWWYALGPEGVLTVPFQRHIRSRCFADGTFTLQFKDDYAQDRPHGFRSQSQNVPVMVHQDSLSFGENLTRLNRARRELNVSQALLIATDLSELEIEGYLRQNVSLSNQRHLQRPLTAHCRLCHRDLCPLHGVDSSPVMACRSFLPAEAVV